MAVSPSETAAPVAVSTEVRVNGMPTAAPGERPRARQVLGTGFESLFRRSSMTCLPGVVASDVLRGRAVEILVRLGPPPSA